MPIALVVEGAPPTIDLPAAGALVYLGLIGSGLAYVLWFRGLTLLGPTAASIIGLVNPVVGVLLGVALLGESFGLVHLVAMVLIVGSVLAAQQPVREWFTARLRPEPALSRPGVVAIPKAVRDAHLRENLAAADLELSPDDLAEIDRLHPPPRRKHPLAMI